MYAILQQSGHQYRVSPGDRLVVDRLAAEVGSVVALEPVVLVAGDGATQIGTPVVSGARVAAVVVSHRKGAKVRVFKYKAKKRYRRTHGHRSLLTELRVEAVLAAGEPLPKPTPAADEKKPARTRKPKAQVAAEAPGSLEIPTESQASAEETSATGVSQPADAPEPAAAKAPESLETTAESQASAEETPATGEPEPADATKPAAAKTPSARKPRTKKTES